MLVNTFRDNLVWLTTSNPDNNVYTDIVVDINGNYLYAKAGDILVNSTAGSFFSCRVGGQSNQVWDEISSSTNRNQSSASRSLNSSFQISSVRDCFVNYSVEIDCSLSLTTGQSGTVFLEIASDSGFTTDVQELGRFLNANTGALAIGLSVSQNICSSLGGYVPSNYYVRLRTQNNASTPMFTYRSGQEVLL